MISLNRVLFLLVPLYALIMWWLIPSAAPALFMGYVAFLMVVMVLSGVLLENEAKTIEE